MAQLSFNITDLGSRFFDSIPNSSLTSSPLNPGTYNSCGYPTQFSMDLFRPFTDPELPWPGVLIGLTISSIWYNVYSLIINITATNISTQI